MKFVELTELSGGYNTALRIWLRAVFHDLRLFGFEGKRVYGRRHAPAPRPRIFTGPLVCHRLADLGHEALRAACG